MNIKQAIKYFGTQQAMADKLCVCKSAISKWKVRPGGIPQGRQAQIELLTKGKLKVTK